MDESILSTVKLSLGIPIEYTAFDIQILMYLNSVLAILPQLGVGPREGMQVTDEYASWNELLGLVDKPNLYSYVKSYVCLRVRLLFDPPSSSGTIDAMERQMRELEWRITVTTDPVSEDNSDEGSCFG